MNRDIAILRETVKKLTPLLAGKGLRVTQQGVRAYVVTDPKTLEPISVNIPYIPDNAKPDLITAIQGFIDHEVAHVLFTDWAAIRASFQKGEQVALMTNALEDPLIESKMADKFLGSKHNIKNLHRFFIERITKPALDEAQDDIERVNILMVPIIRAAFGQDVFKDFLTKEGHYSHPAIKAVMDKIGEDLLKEIAKIKTTADSLRIAEEICKRLKQNQPPQQGGKGAGKKPHEQDSDQADGDENSDGSKSDSQQGSSEDEGESSSDDDGAKGKSAPNNDDGDEDEEESDDDSTSSESDKGSDDEGEDEPASSGGDDEEGGDQDDTSDDQDEGDEESEDESDASGDEGDDEGDDESGGSGGGSDDEDDANDSGENEDGGGSDISNQLNGEDDGEVSVHVDHEEEKSGTIDGMMTETDNGFTLSDIDNEFCDFDGSIATEIADAAAEDAADAEYLPYTTDFDELAPYNVSNRYSPGWLVQMEDETREWVGVMQKEIQRLLAAQSRSVHTPGFRSGRLHSAGLHRLATGDPRVFRRKEVHTSKDTSIMLLIDNSGSMMGDKMKVAMTAGFALAQTVERVGFSSEVIGFTTKSFYGNSTGVDYSQVGEEQQRIGRQFNRVDPLVHRIYKDYNERLTPATKKRFADASNNQVGLYTNIDGESVEMAAWRLLGRKETRKVMIVLSDGAPCGLNSNEHLKATVEKCTKMGIDMIGIGIKSKDVRHFYPRHIVIDEAQELPGAVMNELRQILLA